MFAELRQYRPIIIIWWREGVAKQSANVRSIGPQTLSLSNIISSRSPLNNNDLFPSCLEPRTRTQLKQPNGGANEHKMGCWGTNVKARRVKLPRADFNPQVRYFPRAAKRWVAASYADVK